MSWKTKWWLQLCLVGLIIGFTGCKSKKGDAEVVQRPVLTPKRSARMLERVAEAQVLVDQRKVKPAKAAYKAIQQDFAELVDYDLGLFSKAEIFLARTKRTKAVKKYTTLCDDFPQSELLNTTYQRRFEIGSFYLEGPVIANLLLFKIRGYDRGIKVLEDLTEEMGMEDANGLGTRATLAIAENLEERGKIQDAYLKWLELSTAWDEGDLGKKALLGMARTKLAAYKLPPEKRRVFYDGAHLVNAKIYYEQFALQYPQDANELNVSDILDEIEELRAAKELSIAQFYDRTGETQAAYLYFNMVAQNWPQTKAGAEASAILEQKKAVTQ